jgi:hypothetical protein
MLKDKIQEILNKFNVKLNVEEPAKVALSAMARTIEGIEVGTPADEFAEGVEIYVTIEGEVIPAPDGDHTLEDGTVVNVADGKIVSITAKTEEMSSEVTEIISQLAERVNALETANATQATELSALKVSNADLTSKLASSEKKVTELSKQAAAPSVKDKTELAKAKKSDDQPSVKPFEKMTYTERVLAQFSN